MFNIFKKKEIDENLYAPVDGNCINLEDVPDKVFSSKMMGEGVGFTFDSTVVCAPCNGKVTMIANTKHAFGIAGDNGVEVLVHIGLDTVNLQGEGFTTLVQVDKTVKKGTPIIEIDRALMSEKGIDLTTPMIVTNSSDFTLTTLHIGDRLIKGETAVVACKK